VVGRAVRTAGYEVVRLVDLVAAIGTYSEFFPGVPAEGWVDSRARYAELFDGDSLTMPSGSFLVRSEADTLLVDTGVGPSGGDPWPGDREGRFLKELDRVGVRPDDVDTVFLTHVHVDHIGWSSAFGGARFVTHRDGIALATERGRDLPGGIEPISGETELVPGVVAFETPGHLGGHMSVRVGEDLVILGDAAAHPAQLAEPERVFAFDEEPHVAVETRRELLAAYGDRILACGHYPGSGIGRMVDGAWSPLA